MFIQLDRLVAGVVDGVGMSHPAKGAGGAFQYAGTAINGKLRLAIEDHEHLLALVMEVVANPTLRLKDAPMQEVKVGVKGMAVQQNHQIHLAGPLVDPRRPLIFGRVRVGDALRQGFARRQR
jgi:hypothetical protein